MTRVLVAGSRARSERSDAETRPLLEALAARGIDAPARLADALLAAL